MKIKLCSDDLFTVMKAPREETVGEAGSHDYGESQLDHNDHDLFSHPTNKARKHTTLSSSTSILYRQVQVKLYKKVH